MDAPSEEEAARAILAKLALHEIHVPVENDSAARIYFEDIGPRSSAEWGARRRPETYFERIAQREGRYVWDLFFVRDPLNPQC